jgi:diaminohydroxyphosphoribosylaminopyrimidine deaminase / 5-amino-6-(5-phosphoribosylamino)uracil reductase
VRDLLFLGGFGFCSQPLDADRMKTHSLDEIRPKATDDAYMQRALELARNGTALAHPNPLVGAVLAKSGRVVGEGFHVYEKLDHAEIVALKQAAEKARGATLYVTLEPCCTTGRTGPCTKAIIAAGVKRVVAAMQDPSPKVAGRGFAELKRAGMKVDVGISGDEARRTNEDFAKWIRTGLPFVTLKAACTLDGQIAAREGKPTAITSKESLLEGQRMRHRADAIITGIGTVLADDPRMTDRSGEPRRRKLLRVVVDSRLRIPLRSALVKSADGDVTVFTIQREGSTKFRALSRAGVEVVRVEATRGRVDLHSVLCELGHRQILNLQVEGGAELNGSMLELKLVDKMALFYSPRIMGFHGVPVAKTSPKWFAKGQVLANLKLQKYGPDFAVEGYFHDVYRHHRSRRKN